jgi:putative MFS transporter
MVDSTQQTSLIPARLERLPMTRVQFWIWLLSALGILFGAADIFTIFSVGVNISQAFNLSSAGFALVVASAAPAGVVGAFVAGRLGDSFGRKSVFQYTLLLYFIGSIISFLSPNFITYLIGRLILGFGIGGELPVVLSLISEYSPKRWRGPLNALINGMYAIGALIAANLALYFISHGFGWRPLYLVLAIPALVVLGLRRWGLPESVRWLIAKGRIEEAQRIVSVIEARIKSITKKELPPLPSTIIETKPVKSPLREIVRDARLLLLTILLSWAWFITSFGGISLEAYWIPVMTHNLGYSDIQALTVYTYASDFNLLGVALGVLTIELLGRKSMLIATYVLYGLSYILFGALALNKGLVLFALIPVAVTIVWNFSIILGYTPELFPTRNRSSGNGIVTAVYNFEQVVGPYIVTALLSLFVGTSVVNVFYLTGILLLITAIPFVWVRETKLKSLEEIAV